MLGITLGVAISICLLGFGFTFGGVIITETKDQQRIVLAILITIILISGGVAGWAFSTLL